MRKINVLVASVLLSVAYASGGLVTLSDKRWPAYLDLAPLKNGLPLLSGRDDGIPDSPLFHGVLWIISELLGIGAGVVVASALCVFVFIYGSGTLYRSLNLNAVSGVAFLASGSFVLTRFSYGQVAFLAGLGVMFLIPSLALKKGDWLLALLLAVSAGLLSPHASLLGAVAVFVIRKNSVRTLTSVAAGVVLSVWPVVLTGYGEIGGSDAFYATRPWYESLLLQTGFWNGDAVSWGSLITLFAVAAALRNRKPGAASLVKMWLVSCVLYLIVRAVKSTGINSDTLSFLRDEHKILVLAALSLSGLASMSVGTKKISSIVLVLAVLFIGFWSIKSSPSFSREETKALQEISSHVERTVAVWPASRYNRISESGAVSQDSVSRVLVGGTNIMGESSYRREMSSWMAQGGSSEFVPYFETLVVIKYGQQGYGWLEKIATRENAGSVSSKYFDVYHMKDWEPRIDKMSSLIVVYYLSLLLVLVSATTALCVTVLTYRRADLRD